MVSKKINDSQEELFDNELNSAPDEELLIIAVETYRATRTRKNKNIVLGIVVLGVTSLYAIRNVLDADISSFDLTLELIWVIISSGIAVASLILLVNVIFSKIGFENKMDKFKEKLMLHGVNFDEEVVKSQGKKV